MNDWRARVRLAIKRSGRTHSAVARDAGIAPETLSRILNDADSSPQFQTFLRIVHAVHESVGWVLGERAYSLSWHDRKRLREAGEIIAEVTRDGEGP